MFTSFQFLRLFFSFFNSSFTSNFLYFLMLLLPQLLACITLCFLFSFPSCIIIPFSLSSTLASVDLLNFSLLLHLFPVSLSCSFIVLFSRIHLDSSLPFFVLPPVFTSPVDYSCFLCFFVAALISTFFSVPTSSYFSPHKPPFFPPHQVLPFLAIVLIFSPLPHQANSILGATCLFGVSLARCYLDEAE